MCKYLIRFGLASNGFNFPELESLASLFGVKLNYLDYDESFPFLILTADDKDKLYEVVKRSVLIKDLLQLIEYDEDKKVYFDKLRNNDLINNSSWTTDSFKIEVETFNRKTSMKEKIDRIEELNSPLSSLKGEIKMKDPTNKFFLIESYKLHETSRPVKFFFARFLIDSSRRMMDEFRLTDRKFITNTSMDVMLSFIMANLAQVKANDLVLDLFCGSGSLLIPAAKFGAYTIGTDLHYQLLHGQTKPTKVGVKQRDKDENNRSNFKQYKIEDKYLDVIIADSSLPLFRDSVKFDSIITDPPYGIRESALKIGSKDPDCKIQNEYLTKHLPQKIEYNLYNIVKDLLNYSSRALNLGGRLVFFYPISKSTYDLDDLPTHSCFKYVSHTSQPLSGKKYLRILICLEKIKEPIMTANKCVNEENVPDLIKSFKETFHHNRIRPLK